jgi:hypothetical protein
MALQDYPTRHLIRAAHRFTPAADLASWVATKPGHWADAGDGVMELRLHGEQVDRMLELDLRECVIEQLAELGVDDARINRAMS